MRNLIHRKFKETKLINGAFFVSHDHVIMYNFVSCIDLCNKFAWNVL